MHRVRYAAVDVLFLVTARPGRRVQSEPLSPPRWGGKVDRLTDWARTGVGAFHGLSLLQLGLLAALGLGLGYGVLGVGLRSIRRAVLMALLLIAAVAGGRRGFPRPFCPGP